MGACASKTNEGIEDTTIPNMENEQGFTSPVMDGAVDMAEFEAGNVVDGGVETLPQTEPRTETLPQTHYEVVENPAGNVDPIHHLDASYQNQGFTVTEQPVTHIMVREGVYMNKQTNEIIYDTAVFPNGAEDVAHPMDPVHAQPMPGRGYDLDAEPMADHYPSQPISYDQNPPIAYEEAAFAPQAHNQNDAPQENNLMVGVAMAQEAPQPAADELNQDAYHPDEAPQPEADVPEQPAEEAAPVENKKRRKKKSKKSRKGWGW